MLMAAKSVYTQFNPLRKQLLPYTKFFMEPSFSNNIAPQHVSLCYFSYEDRYPKELVQQWIPDIKSIISMYLPIRLRVCGLQGWWERKEDFPVLCWNVLDWTKIDALHKEIIQTFADRVKHFSDKTLAFSPHIGVAYCPDAKIGDLKQIVAASKNHEHEFELTFDSAYIFFPEGPEKILDLKV